VLSVEGVGFGGVPLGLAGGPFFGPVELYIYIYIYIYISVHIYTYISIYISIYLYIYIHIYTYIEKQICIYIMKKRVWGVGACPLALPAGFFFLALSNFANFAST